MMGSMDIKIGFADSPRELVITTDTDQNEVAEQVAQALTAGELRRWVTGSRRLGVFSARARRRCSSTAVNY